MYAITTPDGPEFDEGDDVVVVGGMFDGERGVITGYDDDSDIYLVKLDELEDMILALPGSMIDLDIEEIDADEDDDLPRPPVPGDRVVVMQGHWVGLAGTVLRINESWSTKTGFACFDVALEDDETISIAAESLEVSLYQSDDWDAALADLVEADMVNHPPHYTSHPSGVEVIEITEHMNFCLGNAVKYILRADLKGNAIEDLEKAAWYIEREIDRRSSE